MLSAKRPCLSAIMRLGLFVCALLAAGSALAQDAKPQPPTEPAGAAATPPPVAPLPVPDRAFQPGFIEAFSRWLGHSKAKIDEQLQGTQETIGGIGSQATDAVKDAAGAVKDVAGAAKQATGVIVGLPNTRIINGRQLCPLAANGALDCAPAADALCRAKGYGAGRGLDINSANKCPRWVWLSGRAPAEGECRIETFVTRAVCQ